MGNSDAQFVGAAGQYYLSYYLSSYNINASITIGNAPSVDVLASSNDGRRSLAFQVKSSRNAFRNSRYGHEGYEWDVGKSVIGKWSETLWYAFIDFQETNEMYTPQVFFVPSKWVAEFVKPDWSRLYFLPTTAKELTLNRLDVVQSYLAGEPAAIHWATDFPEDKLVKWCSESELKE